MDLPELTTDASDAVEGARDRARSLIPWLPDPYICDECNVYCEATREYDPQTAAFYPLGERPAWTCPKCGRAYRRESY